MIGSDLFILDLDLGSEFLSFTLESLAFTGESSSIWAVLLAGKEASLGSCRGLDVHLEAPLGNNGLSLGNCLADKDLSLGKLDLFELV